MAKYLTTCCNSQVESKHRHDFQACPCGKTHVDGGDVYSRIVGDYPVKDIDENGNVIENDNESN